MHDLEYICDLINHNINCLKLDFFHTFEKSKFETIYCYII